MTSHSTVVTGAMRESVERVAGVAHAGVRAGRVVAAVLARRTDITLVHVHARDLVAVDLEAARTDALEAADRVHALVRAALIG